MLRPMTLRSIPEVVDVLELPAPGLVPDLVIEVPHGATQTRDFTQLAEKMRSPLPTGLVDFFHVNTDTGASELGEAVARRFVAAHPSRSVAILRCRIPRTFIDCNRVVDASPEDFKAGKVTPGIMPWITDPEDLRLLRERYDAYVATVREAAGSLGSAGAMLLLHSYAPRTVDVEVDLDIVAKLHEAYRPEVEHTWPLRPDVDVIGRGPDGASLAPAHIVDALREELAAIGLGVADSATYHLHPSTLAWEHVQARPGRAICIEVRRDLMADRFEPFAQQRIDAGKIERLAGPFAAALARWW
jgi:predicted N-formylglutamate amidohydrolase